MTDWTLIYGRKQMDQDWRAVSGQRSVVSFQWSVFSGQLSVLRNLCGRERRLGEKVERERLVMAALPEMDLKIIEFVREHGRATMADAVRVTGANRNTLKVHLRSLVEGRHLVRHGKGKGSWYGVG